MPRKKVTFVKTKEVKEGKFKGFKKPVKSKKMSEKRAQKKQAKGQGFISKAYGSDPIAEVPNFDGLYKGSKKDSNINMNYSPNKMESNKQEKYNLMHDNPVVSHASWLSKHAQSSRMSPLNQERPDPSSLINDKGQDQTQVMQERSDKIQGFRDRIKDLQFNTQEQADKANAIDARNVNAYNKSLDSIRNVNVNYNKRVDAYNKNLQKKNDSINDILNKS